MSSNEDALLKYSGTIHPNPGGEKDTKKKKCCL